MSAAFRKFPLLDITSPSQLSQAIEYLITVLPEHSNEEMPAEAKEERMKVMAMIQAYKNKDQLDQLLGECGILPPR